MKPLCVTDWERIFNRKETGGMNTAYKIVLFLSMSIALVYSQDFRAEQPVLVTSAGQSSDVLMGKILASKAKLEFLFNKQAQTAQLDSVKSVIIVSGGSVKGMGAAGIDKDQEYARVKSIITAAQKKKLPVIGMHLGGKSRRGSMSDEFNRLVAENSAYLIVVREGDDDGFFTSIAKEKNITCEHAENIVSVQQVLEKIYGSDE